MKASELLVKALENEGVGVIYGVPGEENLDFLEARRQSKIRLILTRHEQGAAFMAATYGRLTGNPGVCLSTLGPGATNLVTGAAYAQLGAFPMVMLTGQKPITRSKQGYFQIIDTVDMMRPLTKFTKQLVNVSRIPGNVREAFRQAREERPGAVHLELPEDVATETVDESATFIFETSHTHLPEAGEKVVREAAEMIREAHYPLLLIGAGANRNRVSAALRDFVATTGIFFFDTQKGKFDNPDFVHYAQSYGASGHRVRAAGELAPLLEQCFAAGGVHLVEVPVDYSENNRVLIDELKAKTCLV